MGTGRANVCGGLLGCAIQMLLLITFFHEKPSPACEKQDWESPVSKAPPDLDLA